MLVERADRLARDLIVSEMLVAEFQKMGVSVLAADSGTDLAAEDDDPAKKLIRQMLAAMSEFEKSTIVLKLRAARDRVRTRQGKCEGAKSFGDYVHEKPVLQRIRELNRKPRGGKRPTPGAIAKALNAEGLPTRYGRPWQGRTVRNILLRAGLPRD